MRIETEHPPPAGDEPGAPSGGQAAVGLAAHVVVQRTDFRLDVALRVEPGEVVGLLGPNGAGKTTLLRSLAGLQDIDDGRIVLGAQVLADARTSTALPAHRRPIGVVFQDYLLFPHLSVADNVAFGLRSRGHSKSVAAERAQHWLVRVGAADLASRRPRSLSGGQAQRVALARALAADPSLLLLDEPLAALDARTRLLVRGELRRHLRAYEGAVLLVTHDPVDAAVLADRLVVIEEGRVVQSGAPLEVARRPRTEYVARLVGLNLLRGQANERVVTLTSGGRVHIAEPATGPVSVSFRPAAVALFTAPPQGSPRNIWTGAVAGLEPHGHGVRVEVIDVLGPGSQVLAEITEDALAELGLRPGSPIWVSVKASEIEVYAT